jgi:hypothetical protein
LAESLAATRGPTAAHRVTAWAMVCRQTAFTFTSILHTHPDVAEGFCHLDYRYADLMLQLPATWLYRRAFYSFMIYDRLPALRHVPYANIGRVLSGCPPTMERPREPLGLRAMQQAGAFGRRAIGRIVRSISPARAAPPSLVFEDKALLDEVQECIHSIPMLREVLDVQRCDALLERTRAGTCPSEEILGGLTSLCVSAEILPGAGLRSVRDVA